VKLALRIAGMSTLILVVWGGDVAAAAVYRVASTADSAPGSILGVGVGAALSLVGLRRHVRRRREAAPVPRRWFRRRAMITVKTVPTAPWVEGHSDDPRIGEFAGFLFAKASLVPAGGDGDRRGATRYWVHDAQKTVPVWVCLEDIGHCRWPSRAARSQAVPVRRSILDGDVAAPVAVPSAVAAESVRPVERAEESAATPAAVRQQGPSTRRRRGARARQAA
jgi:hypothetical protein